MGTAIERNSNSELELRDYVRVLGRRKKIVLLALVVVVGAALLASYVQEPVYAASSRVLLRQNQSESPFDPNTGQRADPARALATDIEILKSQLVKDEVRRILGSAPKVTAAGVGQTDVVQITAESADPKRAVLVADTYATAYIDVRRKQAVEGLLKAGEQIQERITELQRDIALLDDQETPTTDPGQAAARDSIDQQRLVLVQQQAALKDTLDKLSIEASLASGGAQGAGRAVLPTSPVRPKPIRNAVLAAVVGLMLGIGLAFLAEYLDDSVKTRDDLERLSGRVPVIGVIPLVGGWKERDDVQLVSIADTTAPAAESYRTLRTAIQFLALDRPMGILQVTSSNPGEGKTTTMANLGVALAQAGQRVILVCCDLRRPRVHEFFGLSNEVGFTSMLLGEAPISRALQAVPGVPRLRLLASGPLPPNPSELLSSGRTKEVFMALKADADIVLIDSPPVLPVTDALVLFRHVDATLMVFSAGSTTQKQASTALAMALQVDAPLVGTVLNNVPSTGGYGAAYAYDYKPVLKKPAAQRPAQAAPEITKGDPRVNGATNGRVQADGTGDGDAPAKKSFRRKR